MSSISTDWNAIYFFLLGAFQACAVPLHVGGGLTLPTPRRCQEHSGCIEFLERVDRNHTCSITASGSPRHALRIGRCTGRATRKPNGRWRFRIGHEISPQRPPRQPGPFRACPASPAVKFPHHFYRHVMRANLEEPPKGLNWDVDNPPPSSPIRWNHLGRRVALGGRRRSTTRSPETSTRARRPASQELLVAGLSFLHDLEASHRESRASVPSLWQNHLLAFPQAPAALLC